MSKLSIFKGFTEFLGERKKWCLTPIVLFLFLFETLIVLTEGTAIFPFIYALL